MPEHPLENLLNRSAAFEEALQAHFSEPELPLAINSQRHELVAAAASLALEHGAVLLNAFGAGAPNSGAALLRLQYEAVLRAAWLLFAADEGEVDKLGRALDLDSEQAAKRLPGYLDMLTAVEKAGPLGLTQPLVEFNRYSRHAMNSFVHSGIHPLTRVRLGFPLEMAEKLLRFSNALRHLAYRLQASLTGQQRRMDLVTHLYRSFTDCLPMAPGA